MSITASEAECCEGIHKEDGWWTVESASWRCKSTPVPIQRSQAFHQHYLRIVFVNVLFWAFLCPGFRPSSQSSLAERGQVSKFK